MSEDNMTHIPDSMNFKFGFSGTHIYGFQRKLALVLYYLRTKMLSIKLNDVKEIVRNYLLEKNAEILTFNLLPLGENVNGFMGEHLTLKIECKIEDETHNLQFFAKRCPDTYSKYLDYTAQAFGKEIFFFDVLMKRFKESCTNAGRDLDETFTANFCFSKKNNLIVLEDLSTLGFKLSPLVNLDKNHLYLISRRIAQLHASTFAYEEFETAKRGKVHRVIYEDQKQFLEPLFQQKLGNPIDSWFDSCFHCITTLIDYKYGTKAEEFKKNYKNLTDSIAKFMIPNMKYRNVVSHGDLWANNIMFLYNNEGLPIDCKLIDYQLLRYVPPCYDAMFPFFTCVERKYRHENMQTYLSFYYNCLTKELNQLGLNIKDILPLREFEETCNDFIPYMAITKSYYFTVMKVTAEALDKISKMPGGLAVFLFENRTDIVFNLYKSDNTFRSIMDDMLEDIYEVTTSNKAINRIKLL